MLLRRGLEGGGGALLVGRRRTLRDGRIAPRLLGPAEHPVLEGLRRLRVRALQPRGLWRGRGARGKICRVSSGGGGVFGPARLVAGRGADVAVGLLVDDLDGDGLAPASAAGVMLLLLVVLFPPWRFCPVCRETPRPAARVVKLLLWESPHESVLEV